ncbi:MULTISPECIES: exonuclease SbcCD subunit D [unclassified Ensifer]|uniref:metallophosphoesterase family protein n=1 Tax=unclassified Ensifer TaxID=2633371 RepID=UPI0008138F55|nr:MULTISPECIES: exonuclease SbcCD subunit D [unclassified Ensifer]OCP01412.1 serine/threonine protein phosphatase [Ensifer sp. LC14]OCP03298.1 serine/threonine protein phosphatase [Ensifer sp. LC11]OCP03671.1 serine/threonine protein phosphatase [Ensifer sp. LC13]OCP34084.1 serine/threonine protein phosphatase [Ensifer sp. LC499]
MPFRFVHTADLHLDSPLRSLALRNADLAEIVRGASRRAFVKIVDLCIAEQVDALLIAGDLYDGSQTSMNTALFLGRELRRLDEAGARVFIIRGNHDAQSQVTNELTLPPSAHVFKGRAKAVLAKTLASGRDVYVHGVSFASPHAPDSLLPAFQSPVPGAVNIGMLHTSLAGAAGHDLYAPCSVADLLAHGFDYWALGHIHQRQVHATEPFVVMPGMPQGRDVNEAGVKGVTLATVGDDGRISLSEQTIGIASFERTLVDITDLSEWRDMLEAIRQTLLRICGNTPAENVILRLTLTGVTPLAWRLRRDADLLRAEIDNIAAGIAGCWIEKVELTSRSAQTEKTGSVLDPVEELAALVEADVLPAHGFRQEVRAAVDDVLQQLPPELRQALAPDEEAVERLAFEAGASGGAEVLAHLHGGGAGEGTH